jgi:hypothetical protein
MANEKWQMVSYSYRSATNGSTLVALRAGMYEATSAAIINTEVTATNVKGSVGETP